VSSSDSNSLEVWPKIDTVVFCLVTVRFMEMSLAMSESLDSRRKREVFDLRDLFSRSDVLLISSMRSGSRSCLRLGDRRFAR